MTESSSLNGIKKWAGMGKELFTSADNYLLEIAEQVPQDSEIRPLIFGRGDVHRHGFKGISFEPFFSS